LNEVGRGKGKGQRKGKGERMEVERVSEYDVRVRVKENTKMESRESVETSTDKHQPNTAGNTATTTSTFS
jgi:hypothetical protein